MGADSEGGAGEEGEEGTGAKDASSRAAVPLGPDRGCFEETRDVSCRKKRRVDTPDVDRNADRKRKSGTDEFEMLGLNSECNTNDTREESELEGFRTGCGSSMRSG